MRREEGSLREAGHVCDVPAGGGVGQAPLDPLIAEVVIFLTDDNVRIRFFCFDMPAISPDDSGDCVKQIFC